MSSLIILILSLNFLFKKIDKFLSFSITINFFEPLLRICEVKFPVPGPISRMTSLGLISATSTILDNIFLSFKKFWPKLFLDTYY